MSGLNDAIKYAHGTVNHELVHPERLADLKVLVEKLNLADMHDLLDQLAQLKVLESHQVNQQLMIEEFAIQSYSLTLK
jgi:DNA polymerase-3 subunit delta'